MLATLTVQNFAIIDNINIDFHSGLTILTGETGAGKSLVIDAMGLLFGNRASSTMIRNGCSKAVVEGVFQDCGQKVMEIIKEEGLDNLDDGMIVVRREINENGKSIIRVNGSVVTLNQLEEIAYFLADIHTQLDTKRLFDVNSYVEFIDDEESLAILAKYTESLKNYRMSLQGYETLKKQLDEDTNNLDFIKYQLNELNRLSLQEDELVNIENEINELNNYEHIFQNLSDIKNTFENNNIVEGLYRIKQNLSKIKEFNSEYEQLSDSSENLYYELMALEEEIQMKNSHLEFDEDRLDYLNERSSTIHELMRKHHKEYSGLLEYQKELTNRVNNFEQNDFVLNEHHQLVKKAYDELKVITCSLTKRRKENAEIVKNNIMSTLKDLCLDKVQLEIVFNKYDFNDELSDSIFKRNGADIVDFLISFNVGEPLKELSKVASGGEMSRVMLAFKTHLLQNLQLSTMIFDEIDTGVSGKVAKSMAEKMKMISKKTQVLAITHLPIVAAAADYHLYINKEVNEGRTITKIIPLSYEERIEELAKMISSTKDDITAQRLAEDMIKNFK